MALLNKEVLPFKATAFHNGDFVDLTDADLRGKWSVVFFYPADFTFVCPTELQDLADPRTPISPTWLGMNPAPPLV